MRLSRPRLYASLMILGVGFLLYRTVSLTAAGYLDIYVLWVSILLIAEMVVDLSCLLASVRWWTHHDGAGSTLALRLGTAVVFIHAVRVLVFALGRTDPFRDFDIAPGQRDLYSGTWTWFGVYFASSLSILSVIAVLTLWLRRERS